MQELRQSTAVTLKIGPFLDKSDGDTEETGLTIAQADVRLSKNGGNIAQKTEATSCTHDELGVYGCPVDATDTAALGRLQLWVHEAGALPVWHEYMVILGPVWDAKYDTDKIQDWDAIKAKTDNLPADPADDSDIDDQLAAIAALLTTEIADILADTNELQSLLADSKMPAQVKGMDANVLTASALATDAGEEIADAVADEVYEGALTLRHMMKIIMAVLAGKSSGGGTVTIKFRDTGDTKDRVTATVEADGDRTAMTLDGT